VQYPTKEDYLKAVQRSASFTGELRRAKFELHPVWQIPKPAAGSSAVVFKATLDGDAQALRFLTREDASRRDRYEALQEHFVGHGLVGAVAMSSWLDDAIRINGRSWPAVRMQWVNGRTLNHYVDHLVEQHDTTALGNLAEAWRQLVVRLQRAEFAHGDLQHGNVLVDERGALRLVDFDCSWIARFIGQPPPTETGHRNYQPANRAWGRWMDTFSGLVVYLSLRALAANPTPWHVLNTGENLLFQRDDFRPPFETPAWAHLSSIRDPELDRLADQLRQCCAPGWAPTGGLGELLTERARPWWELTGTTPVVVARPGPAPHPVSAPAPESVPVAGPLPRPIPTPRPTLPPPPPLRPGPAPPHHPASPQTSQPTGPWWGSVEPGGRPAPPRTEAPAKAPAGAPSGRREGRIRSDTVGSALAGLLAGFAVAGGTGLPAAGVVAGVLVAGLCLLVCALRRDRAGAATCVTGGRAVGSSGHDQFGRGQERRWVSIRPSRRWTAT